MIKLIIQEKQLHLDFAEKLHESIFLLIIDGNLKPVLEKLTKTKIQQKRAEANNLTFEKRN